MPDLLNPCGRRACYAIVVIMARTRTTTKGKKRHIIEALSKDRNASYARIAAQFDVTDGYVAELARKNNLMRASCGGKGSSTALPRARPRRAA